MRDPHQILGVPRTASAAEIKAAYRRLAWELHPDRTGDDPRKTARMKDVTWAYEVLSDPDKHRAAEAGTFTPEDIADVTQRITESVIDRTAQAATAQAHKYTGKLGIAAEPAGRFVQTLFQDLAGSLKRKAAETIREKVK